MLLSETAHCPPPPNVHVTAAQTDSEIKPKISEVVQCLLIEDGLSWRAGVRAFHPLCDFMCFSTLACQTLRPFKKPGNKLFSPKVYFLPPLPSFYFTAFSLPYF